MSNPSEYLASLYALSGKVAVVIGGTGELCGAMAEGLAGAGAEVVLVGRNEEKAKPRLDRIHAAGGKGYFVSAEASEKAALQQLLETVLKRSGKVDIVVNGAGINSATPFFDIAEDEFDRIVKVNLKGVFLCCQAAARQMVKQNEQQPGRGGAIITMSSVNSVMAIPTIAGYNASKGGVNNLTRSMSLALAPHGIRVNGVGPGR
jgi:NAD(P)-dependent dehydrogenase (short-subunit alcohol dehydrogenase family)